MLLVIAVCLLAALVYETHNAPGRYISAGNDMAPDYLLDTATGKAWYYDHKTKEWKVDQPPIPNTSHSIN